MDPVNHMLMPTFVTLVNVLFTIRVTYENFINQCCILEFFTKNTWWNQNFQIIVTTLEKELLQLFDGLPTSTNIWLCKSEISYNLENQLGTKNITLINNSTIHPHFLSTIRLLILIMDLTKAYVKALCELRNLETKALAFDIESSVWSEESDFL